MSFLEDYKYLYNKMIETTPSICGLDEILSPFDYECYKKTSPIGKLILKALETIEKSRIPQQIPNLIVRTADIKISEFINLYISKIDNIDFLIDNNTQASGHVFEFLWQLCINLGVCDDIFPLDEYIPQVGNSNQPETLSNINYNSFFNRKVQSGSTSGYADIIIKKKSLEPPKDVCEKDYLPPNREYSLLQVKYFKDDKKKSVANDYDLAKLHTLFRFDNKNLLNYYKRQTGELPRLMLVINDKDKVLNLIKNSHKTSKPILFNIDIEKDILDKNDLRFYYRKLKIFLERFRMENGYYDIDSIISFFSNKRETLQPRLHQLITLFKTIERLEEGRDDTFLYGAVARSGKTYMMGELINYLNVMGLGNPNRCLGGLSNDTFNQSKKIRRFSDINDNYPWTFVIFSPVPNETVPQYINMFQKYIEFEKYKNYVVVIQGGESLSNFIRNYDNKKPYIIIISKATLHTGKIRGNELDDEELINKETNATNDGLENLDILLTNIKNKGGNVDGIFFDEHHVGGNSENSHRILDRFKNPDMFPNIFYIFITATYNRSILGWNIPSNNIFTWNYEDIILCKDILLPENQEKLRDRHGKYFDLAKECLEKSGVLLEDIQADYRKYPYIFIMDFKWNEDEVKRRLLLGGEGINYGEIFKVNREGIFENSRKVDYILECIGGKTDISNREDKLCFYNRIHQFSSKIGSRTLQDGYFTSQIWFLPHGSGTSGINRISKALKEKLVRHPIFKEYGIFSMKDEDIVLGDQSFSIINQIRNAEEMAKKNNKKGLIILTGKQLSLGISLPCVDIAIMLNDLKQLDMYYQMIFRALTESPGKKAGFICDINPDRIVSAIYNQSMRVRKRNPIEDARRKFLEENMIYFNYDLVMENEYNDAQIIDFFNRIQLKDNKGKSLKSDTMKQVDDELRNAIMNLELNDEITRIINENNLNDIQLDKSNTNEKIKIKEKIDNHRKTIIDIEQNLDIILEEKIREYRGNIEAASEAFEKDIEIKRLNRERDQAQRDIKKLQRSIQLDGLTRLILPIIKIAIFATLDTETNNLQEIFRIVKNRGFFENFRDYLNKIKILKPIQINAVIDNLLNPEYPNNLFNSLTTTQEYQSIVSDIRYDLEETIEDNTSQEDIETVMNVGHSSENDEVPSLLDKKRLLKYIEENLTPIQELKKSTGEVFTPWQLVDEMERTIPNEFWNNPNHKILEPGSGFGPFTIWAYYRLMIGLKSAIPDEEKRRKHIIEKMLFMAELNRANVLISNMIFSCGGRYRPNIYEGDYLKLDPVKEWGVREFDLIHGNPPYNAPKETQSNYTGSIYDSFTYKSIDLSIQFLLFVIPSRWFRKGARGLGDFRDFMVHRKDLKLIKYFENSQDVFGTSVDIKGGVCYFLIDKLYNGLTNFNGNIINLDKQEIITGNAIYLSIIDKTKSFSKLNTLYLQPGYFEISTNFFNTYELDQSLPTVECFVSQTKGLIQKINTKDIKKTFNFWKVITPEAAGKGNDGFGNIYIGNPNQIFSHTYIAFRVKTEIEAVSLQSYLNSNIANFLLSLKKNTQHITGEVLDLIPLPPLEKRWTDIDLYRYFGITREEAMEIEQTLGAKANPTPQHLLDTLDKTQSTKRSDEIIETKPQLSEKKLWLKKAVVLNNQLETVLKAYIQTGKINVDDKLLTDIQETIDNYKSSYAFITLFNKLKILYQLTHLLMKDLNNTDDWYFLYDFIQENKEYLDSIEDLYQKIVIKLLSKSERMKKQIKEDDIKYLKNQLEYENE